MFFCTSRPAPAAGAVQQWLYAHGLEFWPRCSPWAFYSAARFSEVLRSGHPVHPAHPARASVASGSPPSRPNRYVILPVALRLNHPPGHERVAEPAQELVGRAHHQRRELTSRRARSRPIPPRPSRRSPRVRSSTWCSASPSPRSCPGWSGAPPFRPHRGRPAEALMSHVAPTINVVGGLGRSGAAPPQSELMLDLDVIWRNFRSYAPGLPGLRQLRGGTLRLAIPSIILGFLLGIFIASRGWPPVGSACRPPCTWSLPWRPAGHGDLLDVGFIMPSCSRRPSRSSGWR